jgi:hypothetical protein
MDLFYGRGDGGESGNCPIFLPGPLWSGSASPAVAIMPWRMANSAAAVRVRTPSLA